MKKININMIFTIFIVFTMLYTIVLLICPYAVSKAAGIQDYSAFSILKEKGEVFADSYNSLITIFVILGLFLLFSTLIFSGIINNRLLITLFTAALLLAGTVCYMIIILDVAQDGIFSTGIGPILSLTAYAIMLAASILTGVFYREQQKIKENN